MVQKILVHNKETENKMPENVNLIIPQIFKLENSVLDPLEMIVKFCRKVFYHTELTLKSFLYIFKLIIKHID